MKTEKTAFDKAAELLINLNLKIVSEDKSRPWGGFYVIDETQAAQFAKKFFPEEDFEKLKNIEILCYGWQLKVYPWRESN